MKYFIHCFKHYADFKGRARRQEYWYFYLFMFLITIVLALGCIVPMIIQIANNPEVDSDKIDLFILKNPCLYLFLIFYIGSFIPTLAVTVRRLHDIGKPGWWLLIYYGAISLVQIIPHDSYRLNILYYLLILPLSIIFLVCMFTNSQPGPNQYGPNPKGEGNPEDTKQIEE